MGWNIVDLESQLLIGSTLVEGSTLTEAQAREVLRGRTLVGHPIHETRELLNYRAAVEWLMETVQTVPYISADVIQQFHARLFQGMGGEKGRWKTQANFTYLSTGERFDYAKPADVPTRMGKWIEAFNLGDGSIARAAELYFEFQRIHPFEDGNGRMGRIFIAYWLHWKCGRGFVFQLKDKLEHLTALESAGRGDFATLRRFFEERTPGEPKRKKV